MPNPNNCETCDYKHMRTEGDPDDGWCYMFRDEPDETCMQHTGRKVAFVGGAGSVRLTTLSALLQQRETGR